MQGIKHLLLYADYYKTVNTYTETPVFFGLLRKLRDWGQEAKASGIPYLVTPYIWYGGPSFSLSQKGESILTVNIINSIF